MMAPLQPATGNTATGNRPSLAQRLFADRPNLFWQPKKTPKKPNKRCRGWANTVTGGTSLQL
jgi:hypothetical protein